MPAGGHLLANGFGAGRTWLFDLSAPRAPKILTSFGDLSAQPFAHVSGHEPGAGGRGLWPAA